MTQIGYVVIGSIVVVAAIYLVIFVSQRLTARKVAKLLEQKQALVDVPMRDRLVEGRRMSLTGQSLKQFQLLESKYGQLEKSGFKAIEDQATTVLYDSQGLNFWKTRQEFNHLQDMIQEAQITIDIVLQGLEDLAKLDEAHKEAVTDLEKKYQDLRKILLAQNFTFGPAIDKLEEILGSLEDDFAEFSRLTEEGDHATAADIYETLGMETNQLEQRIAQIPDLFTELDEQIPAQLKELQDAYAELTEKGFRFKEDLPTTFTELEKQRKIGLDLLAALTLKKVNEQIGQIEAKLDSLYALFEKEAAAEEVALDNHQMLNEYIHFNNRQNHDLTIELDRLNQDYVFSKDEVGQVADLSREITRLEDQWTAMDEAVKAHEVIFSEMDLPQAEMRAALQNIETTQANIWKTLQGLPKIVQQSRNRVMILADKLRLVQRSVERQGLPGVPESYLQTFYAVSDELGRLTQQLNMARINVDDVQRQLSIVTADMDTLQEATDALLEAAAVTERLVRKAMQYRDQPGVTEATQQARAYYENDYDFVQAMNTLGTTLSQFEPNVLSVTVNQYRTEKATLEAEMQA
jgi:septation ring formation regulator